MPPCFFYTLNHNCFNSVDYLQGELYKSYIGSKMSLCETKFLYSVVKFNFTGTSLVLDTR